MPTPARPALFATLLATVFIASTAEAETWAIGRGNGVLRAAHVTAKLPSGKLLVAGGSFDPVVRATDAYDSVADEWLALPDLAEGRAYTCATTLADGRVMILGGMEKEGVPPIGAKSTVEIFDETKGAWAVSVPMLGPRRWEGCATLKDGRVIVVGGSLGNGTELATTELFDPKTSAWTKGPDAARTYDAARLVVLDDGRVLATVSGHADVFDPKTSTWTAVTGQIPAAPSVTLLADGRVFMVGWTVPAAIVDPTTLVATAVPGTTERGGAAAARFADGRVLFAGGADAARKPLSTAEIFDPKTKAFTKVDPMRAAHLAHTASVLPNGRVVFIGGIASKSSADLGMQIEIFNAFPGASCTRGEECQSGFCVDGVCCDKACNGACEACGEAGKQGICSGVDGAPRAGHATCAPFSTCTKGACATSCAGDAQCSAGNVCWKDRCAPEKGICDGDGTVVSRDGTRKDCGAFACTPAGDCMTTCANSSDCRSGKLCDAGACIDPKPPEEAASSCAVPVQRGRFPLALLFLAALVAVRARRRARVLLFGAALSALSIGCSVDRPASLARRTDEVVWKPAELPQGTPFRVFATSTRLVDGRVLVLGGTAESALSTALIYDGPTGKWANAGAMTMVRAGHTATALADGRILVVGGEGAAASSAEIYDPVAGTSSKIAAPTHPRNRHAATPLADGRVVIVGGADASASKSVEIFDPASGAFTVAAGLEKAHRETSASLLPNGRVLIVGGKGAGTTVEIFDPASGSFALGPPTAGAHEEHSAVVLPDHRVLVAGGAGREVEIHDPATQTWKTLGTLSKPRYGVRGTVLASGRVLLAGGSDVTLDEVFASTELVDPLLAKVTPVRVLDVPRTGHVMERLPDGRVLVFGGVPRATDDVPVLAVPILIGAFDGERCEAAETCGSGSCIDATCCATACTNACSACNVKGHEGTCTAIDGRPRAGHDTCAPYGTCVAGGCLAVCVGDEGCDDTHVCDVDTATCVAPKATCQATIVTDTVTGTTKDCAPYRCASRGTCLRRCSTSDDCATGTACADSVCTAGVAAADDGSCSVATPLGGSSTRDAGPALTLLLVAAVGMRRGVTARRRS